MWSFKFKALAVEPWWISRHPLENSDDKRKSSFCGKSSNQKAVVFYSKVLVYLEGILFEWWGWDLFQGIDLVVWSPVLSVPQNHQMQGLYGPNIERSIPSKLRAHCFPQEVEANAHPPYVSLRKDVMFKTVYPHLLLTIWFFAKKKG